MNKPNEIDPAKTDAEELAIEPDLSGMSRESEAEDERRTLAALAAHDSGDATGITLADLKAWFTALDTDPNAECPESRPLR